MELIQKPAKIGLPIFKTRVKGLQCRTERIQNLDSPEMRCVTIYWGWDSLQKETGCRVGNRFQPKTVGWAKMCTTQCKPSDETAGGMGRRTVEFDHALTIQKSCQQPGVHSKALDGRIDVGVAGLCLEHRNASPPTGCGFCLAGRCRIGTWNESDLFGAQKRVSGRGRHQQAGRFRTFLAYESAARYVVPVMREQSRRCGQLRQKWRRLIIV